MSIVRSGVRRALFMVAATAGLVVVEAGATHAAEFDDKLALVDKALRSNPNKVPSHVLESCYSRRSFALKLYYSGQTSRAKRSLDYCYDVLEIVEKPPEKVDKEKLAAERIARVQAKAAAELERALVLEPNIENGLKIYRDCASCHMPEAWGLSSGMVPQLAGQHRKVLIKQLADIRAGNRDNVLMVPYSSMQAIGGAQAVADVAGYIDTLEISVENGRGPGDDLALGEKLYKENCARCHGEQGEGDNDKFMPRLQSQHYNYLVRQFEWIREGKRRNADVEMAEQIQGMKDREMHAVLDYVSRLEPPEELQAPKGWHNPDFGPQNKVGWMPTP